MPSSLDIIIRTIADNQGLKLTDEQVKRLTESMEQAGKGQKAFARETQGAKEQLNHLRESGRGGAEVLDGISRASQGGVAGLFGVAQAFRGLISVLRGAVGASGILGLAVIAIGGLIAGFVALKNSVWTNKEAQTDFSVALKKSSDAVQELNEQKLDDITKQTAELAAEADRYYAVIQKTLQLQGKTAEVEAAAKIAAITSNPNLTDAEKSTQIFAVNKGLVVKKRALEEQGDDVEINKARNDAERKDEQASRARIAYENQKKRVEQIEQDKIDRDARIGQLQKTLQGAKPEQGDLFANVEVVKLAEELRRLQIRKGFDESADGQSKFGNETKNLSGLKAASDSAGNAAADARNNFSKVSDLAQVDRDARGRIQKAEDEKQAIDDREAQRQAIKDTESKLPRQLALKAIHELPGDRPRQVEEELADRTVAAQKASAGKDGHAAGETLGAALVEVLGTYNASLVAAIKSKLQDVNADLQRKNEELEKQLKALR